MKDEEKEDVKQDEKKFSKEMNTKFFYKNFNKEHEQLFLVKKFVFEKNQQNIEIQGRDSNNREHTRKTFGTKKRDCVSPIFKQKVLLFFKANRQ